MKPGSARRPIAGGHTDPHLRGRWTGPSITSFAQNGEDVRLWRVFADRRQGFYVDVGAGHPTADSVTRLFYDAGWTGINIEPGPEFEHLREARPLDTNLEVAIAVEDGAASMSVSTPDSGLSSLRPAPPDALPDGFAWIPTVVRTTRLDAVVAEHAEGREIDFLKVDVEGSERDVLASFDPRVIRPKVVLVEAVAPLSHRPTHDEWEPLLVEADYVLAAFDGINRFYVPVEHEGLIPALSYPLSALDNYVTWSPLEAAVREATSVTRAMESTLSWRITKPLRAVRRAQRRAASRAKRLID